MYGPGRVIVTFCLLAAAGVFGLLRLLRGPGPLQVVIAVFAFSAIGAGAFLLGRSHARSRRERRNDPPPP